VPGYRSPSASGPIGFSSKRWAAAGAGVGVETVGVAVGVEVDVGVGVTVGVGEGDGVQVGVGVGVGVKVGVGVAVNVGVPSTSGWAEMGDPTMARIITNPTKPSVATVPPRLDACGSFMLLFYAFKAGYGAQEIRSVVQSLP
jgi:hypothetical protein